MEYLALGQILYNQNFIQTHHISHKDYEGKLVESLSLMAKTQTIKYFFHLRNIVIRPNT